MKFLIQEEGLHYVEKTKALISCVVIAQLILVFVLAYANCKFSPVTAHIWLSRPVYVVPLVRKVFSWHASLHFDLSHHVSPDLKIFGLIGVKRYNFRYIIYIWTLHDKMSPVMRKPPFAYAKTVADQSHAFLDMTHELHHSDLVRHK